jgi:microcystin-dependent protein
MPFTPAQIQATVSSPSSSLCGNFVNTLLKLPLLIYNFFSTLMDTNGNLSATFLSMIYTPGELKMSFVPLSTVQNDVVTGLQLWLPCNGSIYPITQYPDLYAAIGDAYAQQTNPNILDGSGNPVIPSAPQSGYFRVPDFRALAPIGTGNFATLGQISVGNTVGEEDHTLVPGEDVPHQHFLVRSDAGPYPSTEAPNATNYIFASTDFGTSNDYSLQANETSDDIVATVGLSSVVGGEESTDTDAIAFPNYNVSYIASPHNNVQPSFGVLFWVFAGVPA